MRWAWEILGGGGICLGQLACCDCRGVVCDLDTLDGLGPLGANFAMLAPSGWLGRSKDIHPIKVVSECFWDKHAPGHRLRTQINRNECVSIDIDLLRFSLYTKCVVLKLVVWTLLISCCMLHDVY